MEMIYEREEGVSDGKKIQALSTGIRMFLKTEIFSFVLAFRPYVNGVLGNQNAGVRNSPKWEWRRFSLR